MLKYSSIYLQSVSLLSMFQLQQNYQRFIFPWIKIDWLHLSFIAFKSYMNRIYTEQLNVNQLKSPEGILFIRCANCRKYLLNIFFIFKLFYYNTNGNKKIKYFSMKNEHNRNRVLKKLFVIWLGLESSWVIHSINRKYFQFYNWSSASCI